MIKLEYFNKEDWMEYSENAHKIAFKEKKPAYLDRIDFALMAVRDQTPMAYVTCREFDAYTVYFQFGGAFPGTKGTNWSWVAFSAFVNFARGKYKRITMAIENTNKPMLKMAAMSGFLINGVRYYNGSLLVEQVLELV